jgi:hypothetical protein
MTICQHVKWAEIPVATLKYIAAIQDRKDHKMDLLATDCFFSIGKFPNRLIGMQYKASIGLTYEEFCETY